MSTSSDLAIYSGGQAGPRERWARWTPDFFPQRVRELRRLFEYRSPTLLMMSMSGRESLASLCRSSLVPRASDTERRGAPTLSEGGLGDDAHSNWSERCILCTFNVKSLIKRQQNP